MPLLSNSHAASPPARLIAVVAIAVALAAYGASLIPGTLGTERTPPAHSARSSTRRSSPSAIGGHELRRPQRAGRARRPGPDEPAARRHDARHLRLDRRALVTAAGLDRDDELPVRPTHWTAADFRLEARAAGREFAPVGGTNESGTLAPGSSLDLVLNYVVPRNGDHFTLRVRDGNRFVRVHLIQVGKAPPGTKGFSHAHETSVVVPKQREGIKQ